MNTERKSNKTKHTNFPSILKIQNAAKHDILFINTIMIRSHVWLDGYSGKTFNCKQKKNIWRQNRGTKPNFGKKKEKKRG